MRPSKAVLAKDLAAVQAALGARSATEAAVLAARSGVIRVQANGRRLTIRPSSRHT